MQQTRSALVIVTVMRPTERYVAAASHPGPAAQAEPPDTVTFALPAHLSFLAVIRDAVAAVVREVGGSSACRRDLQLASDEAAAVLIEDAPAWSEVKMAIAHDDADIYVRLITRRAKPGHRLVIHELTRMLLGSAVQSYDIFAEDQLAYAFLQAPRAGEDPLA
jgi:hypothetical protein